MRGTHAVLLGVSGRVIRYIVVAIYEDAAMAIPIYSDWDHWEEQLYVRDRLSVCQVFCTLGKGYFGE